MGSKPLQLFLLFYHTFLMMVSLGMIVASSLALFGLLSQKTFLETGNNRVLGPPSFLLAVSILSSTVTGFGFCATLRRNRHTLTALFFMSLMLLLMELAAGIWSLALQQRCKSALREALYLSFDDYNFGISSIKDLGKILDKNPYNHPLDVLQSQLNCCGIEGPGNYLTKGTLPMSCCSTDGDNSVTTPIPIFGCISINQQGCLDALNSHVSKYLLLIGFYGIIIAFINVIGSMFIIMFIYSIKRDLEKAYQ